MQTEDQLSRAGLGHLNGCSPIGEELLQQILIHLQQLQVLANAVSIRQRAGLAGSETHDFLGARHACGATVQRSSDQNSEGAVASP